MDKTKEADLVTSVLLYAMRCLAEGDQAALRHMNFGVKEIESLRELRVADLYRVETFRAHCLDIELNRDAYWPMIDNLARQRTMEDVMQALIIADAPQEMMHILFGLNQRDYTRLRRTLMVHQTIGRPPEINEGESHRLWGSWSTLANKDSSGLLGPEQYLEMHRETELSMRAIWTQTQRFAEYGNLNGSPEGTVGPAGEDEQ